MDSEGTRMKCVMELDLEPEKVYASLVGRYTACEVLVVRMCAENTA